MADIPQTDFTDLSKMARALISAHTAVREGIATHAEKHEVATDAKRRKLESELGLKGNMPVKSG